MAQKLGAVLLAKRLITEDQLKKALDTQLIFGGHLGTCMIEMGYLDERVLGEVLSDAFGANYAIPEFFEDVPATILELLPREVAERFQAIPFKTRNGALHVAMVDPGDTPAVTELARRSGRRIVPWVSPEFRIVSALQRYYRVPKRVRFVQLSHQLGEKDSAAEARMQEPVSRAACGPREPQTSRAVPSSEPTGDPGFDPAYARPWQEIAAELFEGKLDNTPAEESSVPGTGGSIGDLDELADALCQARSGAELAGTVVDFVQQMLPRCILFKVKSTFATPWDSRGVDLDPATLESLEMRITWEPLFGLLRGKQHYRGPLPEDASHHEFYQRFLMQPPEELLLWPVHVEDVLVAILYADAGPGASLEADRWVFHQLLDKLALALQLLVIKKKIHVA